MGVGAGVGVGLVGAVDRNGKFLVVGEGVAGIHVAEVE